MSDEVLQTVIVWSRAGYRGLRIPRCDRCHSSSWASWAQLQAEEQEDLVCVAKRMRCDTCGVAPTGLAVVVSTSPVLH